MTRTATVRMEAPIAVPIAAQALALLCSAGLLGCESFTLAPAAEQASGQVAAPDGSTAGTAGDAADPASAPFMGAPLDAPDRASESIPPAGAPSLGTGSAGAMWGAPAPGDSPGALDDAAREFSHSLSPLPEVPPDPTNRVADSADAAEFGRLLFFDPRYSGPLAVDSDLGPAGAEGKVACATCHWGPYLDDQRSVPRNVSLGANYHTRNALPLVNSAFYRWTNWAGRFSSAWELSLPVAESPVIMNSSRLAVAHLIFDHYRDSYEPLFGALPDALGADPSRFPASGKPKPAASVDQPDPPDGAWENMRADDQALVNTVFVNFGKALQAYIRLLVSRDAPFDRFVAGDEQAISDSAKQGLGLFVGRARCVHCHLGPHFSDGQFHNTGVPQVGPHVPPVDQGRFKDVAALLASPFTTASAYSDDPASGRLSGLTSPASDETLGQFRTPSLRGVSLTPPYMHSGQYQTLWDVIDFYDRGGDVPAVGVKHPLMVPLHLNDSEKQALVDFLDSLTGAEVPAHLLEGAFEPPPTNW